MTRPSSQNSNAVESIDSPEDGFFSNRGFFFSNTGFFESGSYLIISILLGVRLGQEFQIILLSITFLICVAAGVLAVLFREACRENDCHDGINRLYSFWRRVAILVVAILVLAFSLLPGDSERVTGSSDGVVGSYFLFLGIGYLCVFPLWLLNACIAKLNRDRKRIIDASLSKVSERSLEVDLLDSQDLIDNNILMKDNSNSASPQEKPPLSNNDILLQQMLLQQKLKNIPVSVLLAVFVPFLGTFYSSIGTGIASTAVGGFMLLIIANLDVDPSQTDGAWFLLIFMGVYVASIFMAVTRAKHHNLNLLLQEAEKNK